MNWLKNKLKSWLGITWTENSIDRLNDLYKNLVGIGIDAHVKSDSMIIIFSKLRGGQVRQIEAKFKNLRELDELARTLKTQYYTDRIWSDIPYNCRDAFRNL